jgi:hypothetical protein
MVYYIINFISVLLYFIRIQQMGTSFSSVSSVTSELKRITSDFISYISGQSANFPLQGEISEKGLRKILGIADCRSPIAFKKGFS